jgi:4-hydroxymandelate oxidase
MDWEAVERTAKERFAGSCRVCRVCDGRACAGEMPGMGGIGTGSSFTANVQALARVKLNLRTLHDRNEPDIGISLFGHNLDMPILAAPVAGAGMNMKNAVTEGELVGALLGGAAAAGSLGMVGDGPNPIIAQAGLGAIKANGGRGCAIAKPRRREEILRLLEPAVDAGAWAVGADVDAAGIIGMVRAGQYVGPRPWEEWADIIAQVKAPFILKGIMTADEAEMAAKTGAAAIVVSNHGGRVLDHTPGTAEVLPGIAERVKGKVTILADGGVRSGFDVLKMLALGADAVLVGRPMGIAAVGGGAEAVATLLKRYADELRSAMILTGCGTLGEVSSRVLWRG